MKLGILTGGGDCPGLNAVIRAVVRTNANAGGQTIGLLEGWRGAVEGNHIELTPENTDHIIDRGGTILGSSRTNPYKDLATTAEVVATFKNLELDALVAIGGDDTLGVASRCRYPNSSRSPLPSRESSAGPSGCGWADAGALPP